MADFRVKVSGTTRRPIDWGNADFAFEAPDEVLVKTRADFPELVADTHTGMSLPDDTTPVAIVADTLGVSPPKITNLVVKIDSGVLQEGVNYLFDPNAMTITGQTGLLLPATVDLEFDIVADVDDYFVDDDENRTVVFIPKAVPYVQFLEATWVSKLDGFIGIDNSANDFKQTLSISRLFPDFALSSFGEFPSAGDPNVRPVDLEVEFFNKTLGTVIPISIRKEAPATLLKDWSAGGTSANLLLSFKGRADVGVYDLRILGNFFHRPLIVEDIFTIADLGVSRIKREDAVQAPDGLITEFTIANSGSANREGFRVYLRKETVEDFSRDWKGDAQAGEYIWGGIAKGSNVVKGAVKFQAAYIKAQTPPVGSALEVVVEDATDASNNPLFTLTLPDGETFLRDVSSSVTTAQLTASGGSRIAFKFGTNVGSTIPAEDITVAFELIRRTDEKILVAANDYSLVLDPLSSDSIIGVNFISAPLTGQNVIFEFFDSNKGYLVNPNVSGISFIKSSKMRLN